MKHLLLAITLVWSSVAAEPLVVVATGVGSTCEKALENAKTTATDKAVGVWIHGEAYTNDNQYNEKIAQYSGGLISSYTVLDNQCTKVTIEATVVPRSNKIVTGSAIVPSDTRSLLEQKIANEKKRQAAIDLVNNRSKAIAFEITDMEFNVNQMSITGVASYQEKWKNDYYDLQKQTNAFNLNSFGNGLMFEVIGFSTGKEVFRNKYQLDYDSWELYSIDRNGKVTIYPNKTDKIKLTFPVDSGKIMTVDKFQVRII